MAAVGRTQLFKLAQSPWVSSMSVAKTMGVGEFHTSSTTNYRHHPMVGFDLLIKIIKLFFIVFDYVFL